jgi:hypothetical protein
VYHKTAAFDEVELIAGLSPSLRTEVTRFVLKETLGKLPMFSEQLPSNPIITVPRT